MKEHIICVHKNIANHICLTCDKKFKSRLGLKLHISNLHDETKKMSYGCEFCEKVFPTKSQTKIHLATIHEKSSQNCKYCDKIFSNKIYLKKHYRRVHENNGQNKCDSWHKEFTLIENLKAHVKSFHAKSKP